MKVPTIENKVAIQSPRSGGVLANTPNAPQVVPAAYGGEIGAAMHGLGNTMVATADKLATHLFTMAKQRSEDIGTDALNKYADDQLQTLHQEKIVVDPKTGEQRTVGGWQGRLGFETDKNTPEFIDRKSVV